MLDACCGEQWLESYAGLSFPMKGRRINVTDCDELEAAIDVDCSYDGKVVDDFTTAMNSGGGHFTMAFWAKPTGLLSMSEDNLFNPAVAFFGKVIIFELDALAGQAVTAPGVRKK